MVKIERLIALSIPRPLEGFRRFDRVFRSSPLQSSQKERSRGRSYSKGDYKTPDFYARSPE